jgi:hypothetical protein
MIAAAIATIATVEAATSTSDFYLVLARRNLKRRREGAVRKIAVEGCSGGRWSGLTDGSVKFAVLEARNNTCVFDERNRVSMLMVLHATCETALEMFSGGANGQLSADLKRILEQTRRELDALAEVDPPPSDPV